jgi:hypothetical protein
MCVAFTSGLCSEAIRQRVLQAFGQLSLCERSSLNLTAILHKRWHTVTSMEVLIPLDIALLFKALARAGPSRSYAAKILLLHKLFQLLLPQKKRSRLQSAADRVREWRAGCKCAFMYLQLRCGMSKASSSSSPNCVRRPYGLLLRMNLVGRPHSSGNLPTRPTLLELTLALTSHPPGRGDFCPSQQAQHSWLSAILKARGSQPRHCPTATDAVCISLLGQNSKPGRLYDIRALSCHPETAMRRQLAPTSSVRSRPPRLPSLHHRPSSSSRRSLNPAFSRPVDITYLNVSAPTHLHSSEGEVTHGTAHLQEGLPRPLRQLIVVGRGCIQCHPCWASTQARS